MSDGLPTCPFRSPAVSMSILRRAAIICWSLPHSLTGLTVRAMGSNPDREFRVTALKQAVELLLKAGPERLQRMAPFGLGLRLSAVAAS